MTTTEMTEDQKLWSEYANDAGAECAEEKLREEMELCRNEVVNLSGQWYLKAWHVQPVDRISNTMIEEIVRLNEAFIQELIEPLYKRIARTMVLYKAGKVKLDGSLQKM